MKPSEGPESFRKDEVTNTYSVDMVPDHEDGVFRSINNKLSRYLILYGIATEDAMQIEAGNLSPLRKYARLSDKGYYIATAANLILEDSGKTLGVGHSFVREYPGFKKTRVRKSS